MTRVSTHFHTTYLWSVVYWVKVCIIRVVTMMISTPVTQYHSARRVRVVAVDG